MENVETKKGITEALEFLTKSELEQLNDFLQYKRLMFETLIFTESANIEKSEEDRIISLFNNSNKVQVDSINQLLFFMKWTKFENTAAGYIYKNSIKNWLGEFFCINEENADEIINYLITTECLFDNGFGNYCIKGSGKSYNMTFSSR